MVLPLLCFLCSCFNIDHTFSDKKIDHTIGQLIMVGFRGVEINESDPIYQMIQQGKVGGVILFDYDVPTRSRPRNIYSSHQLKSLVNKLQSISPIPLFIAIDQEGGYVQRLSSRYGFRATPSHQYLGQYSIDSTLYYADIIAKQLKEHGFNMNLAPVFDLNINSKSPAIGHIERSFGDNPNVVIPHLEAFMTMHTEKNIISVPKHFPGHGSAYDDSHNDWVDITNTWESKEWEPYRQLCRQNKIDAIMMGHIFHSGLDSMYPATMSYAIIHNELKQKLGCKDALIVTDDLQMGALRTFFSSEEIIIESLKAGNDILLFANNSIYDEHIVQKTIDIIKQSLSKGEITIERLYHSYQRIINLKKKRNIISNTSNK